MTTGQNPPIKNHHHSRSKKRLAYQVKIGEKADSDDVLGLANLPESRGRLDYCDWDLILRNVKVQNKKAKNQEKFSKNPPAESRHSECLLNKLQNPNRAGVIPGLEWDGNMVELRPEKWLCCAGTSLQYSILGNQTTRCDLHFRLENVKYIIHRFQLGHINSDLIGELAPIRFNRVVHHLAQIKENKSNRGMSFIHNTKVKSPVSLWAVALAGAWRFGLSSHIVDLEANYQQQVLPSCQKKSPDMLLLMGLKNLSAIASIETLELMLDYAYGAMIPLFIDLSIDEHSPSQGGRDYSKNSGAQKINGAVLAKQGYASIITNIKKKSLDSMLNTALLSKISAVTLGFEDYMSSK